MRKKRPTMEQLDANIKALLDSRKRPVEQTADEFSRAFLTKAVKDTLADLDSGDIKKTAKLLSSQLPKVIAAIKNTGGNATLDSRRPSAEQIPASPDSRPAVAPSDIHSAPTNASTGGQGGQRPLASGGANGLA